MRHSRRSDFGGKWEEKFRNFSGKEEEWEELKEFFLREYQNDQDFRNKIDTAG